jgi:hypothetical protein
MLPPSLPIHQMLTLLSLLDLHCSPHQFGYMTLDVDQKHLGKRMRERIKSKAGIRICGVILDRCDAVRGIARHMHSESCVLGCMC